MSTEIIAGRWKIGNQIGSGTYGTVFVATSIRSGRAVAVKMANSTRKNKQVSAEYNICKHLMKNSDFSIGIPRLYYHGVHNDKAVFVMDYLGLSLHSLLRECQGRFSIKSTYLIALQLMTRIEYIHSQNYIHGDVKPDNLLMGRSDEERTMLYVIDFGLSKLFRDPETKEHIEFRSGKPLLGNTTFCSINAHHGHQISQRDDLECAGYVLVYLFNGMLPWQKVRAADDEEKREKLVRMKLNVESHAVCTRMGPAMRDYFRYVYALPFKSKPDYSFLRRLFLKEVEQRRIKLDGLFDCNCWSQHFQALNLQDILDLNYGSKCVRAEARISSDNGGVRIRMNICAAHLRLSINTALLYVIRRRDT